MTLSAILAERATFETTFVPPISHAIPPSLRGVGRTSEHIPVFSITHSNVACCAQVSWMRGRNCPDVHAQNP